MTTDSTAEAMSAPSSDTVDAPSAVTDPTSSGGMAHGASSDDDLRFQPFSEAGTQTSKEKMLAAILALLRHHHASRMRRTDFASNVLYEHAAKMTQQHQVHAMRMLLAIQRMTSFQAKHLLAACEPPLILENRPGGYAAYTVGNGMQSNHVTLYILRMLVRALNLHWSHNQIDPREAAPAAMPEDTAKLFF